MAIRIFFDESIFQGENCDLYLAGGVGIVSRSEAKHPQTIYTGINRNPVTGTLGGNLFNAMQNIAVNDDLIFVGHYGREKFISWTAPKFARLLIQVLPNGYRGKIYLNGCSTGVNEIPLPAALGNHLFTSYTESVYLSLLRERRYGNFVVKGNLKDSGTHSNGREYNNINALRRRNPNPNERVEKAYYGSRESLNAIAAKHAAKDNGRFTYTEREGLTRRLIKRNLPQ